jgi:hypothetical protein
MFRGQVNLHQRDEVRQRLAAAIRAGIRYAVDTDGMHAGLARKISNACVRDPVSRVGNNFHSDVGW